MGVSKAFRGARPRAATRPRAGELEAAEEVALESLELVERTDALDVHADVLLALADLDRAKGRPEPALVRLGQAIELCERKGDVVSAARAREQMVAA